MIRFPRITGLPRKVVGYYLLFCLVAVCWLGAGAVVTSQNVLNSRVQSACLTRLGQAASAVEIEQVRTGGSRLPELLQRIQGEGRFAYCAVVSPENKYLAHSRSELAGEAAFAPEGELLEFGEVRSIRFRDEQGRMLREYQVPLVARNEPWGRLHAAISEPGLGTTLWESAHAAPWLAFLPLLLVGAGAVVMAQLTSPLAVIEDELRGIARSETDPDSLPIFAANSAALLGWNRVANLVAQRQGTSGGPSLAERLRSAAETRSHDRSEAVLHSLSDGVAVTNPAGEMSFASRAFVALLGSRGEPLVGRKLAGVLHQAFGDNEARDRLVQTTGVSVSSCEWSEAQESGARTLRLTRRPIEAASAGPGATAWILSDVSQQRLAEEARNQFLDMATHELRTPLANIKAYSELLTENESPNFELQKEFCNTINAEATRLARFVDDLLSVSSMEMGALSIERQNVDLGRLLDEVVAKVRPLIEKKQIAFQVTLPDKLPETLLDKDKIVAALVNVLGNAAKYTPEKGRIALTATLNGAQLEIAVEDTGVGIAESEIPKVFEKFFRSDDPRVHAQKGTGLGLSLAREVVRLHGGDILLRSELNKGSTFTLVLPLLAR